MNEESGMQVRKVCPKKSNENGDGWTHLDLSAQGIRNISKALFDLTFIRTLNLMGNEIEVIPSEICNLKNLESLNLSKNKIRCIPVEMGKMVSLKELDLSDNLISNVPMEIGTLYNLEVFEMSNNPLIVPFSTLAKEKKLLAFCREHNTGYSSPSDRSWMECSSRNALHGDTISVGVFNILSNVYASRLTYAPSWVINPDFRREGVLQEIVLYNVDILCLQEIELYNFFDFYKEQLEMRCSYDSIIYPRGRIKNVAEKKNVDGCAIFWRKSKFRLIEQFPIDFYQTMTQDPRFEENQMLLARYGKKDNVAIAALLEKTNGQQVLVVNTHIFWDPEYPDIKLLQTMLLIEEIQRIKSKHPNAFVIVQGDFNSLRCSSVYKSVTTHQMDFADFGDIQCYQGIKKERMGLGMKDAYTNEDLEFTNFTPQFKDVIDYIFYGDRLTLTSVLSPVDNEYTEKIVGLPSIHFPSDHIFLGAKLTFPNKTSGSSMFNKSLAK
ncbi:putative mRNA deadenylase [Ordospora colligata]|uniref:poly(A)-specific ribonuclease n=1 Tax=Ordospora colligata OC4 TaxID=1354746 RepID=A0A0B2UIQ4_9MICR|nr:putative mRNA deadenylase [Ordospora colligata OC4]KHN68845.1 putative mRNA deadenylase [Ordospora colligata OC4]TBU13879.1 putative mRNA deadenylase [Ordospora colligata]TBU14068.1 putative mRNA deadenylase [Ordospora colligata]TBU17737.1 putative mRNA deadenylase [Ordospora colligata]